MKQTPLKTPCGHVVALVVDGRWIRKRCTERTCPDVMRARALNQRCYHVFDAKSGELVRTEFVPIMAKRRAA